MTRFFTYRSGEAARPGVMIHGQRYDAEELFLRAKLTPEPSVRAILAAHGVDLPGLTSQLAAAVEGAVTLGALRPEDLLPPVPDPEKVFCVGLNYNDHVAETGRALPEYPDVFTKFTSSLTGPYMETTVSELTDNLDFEGELALVIGEAGRRITENDALRHVAGAMVLNDVTGRDFQYRGTQWALGKNLERSTPCGPELVTWDEIGDIESLDVETRLNGEVMQRSNTRYFIFSVARIVSYISQVTTLQPGDIIATGTPSGIGAKRTPPLWMQPGDTVEVEIEGLGTLANVIR